MGQCPEMLQLLTEGTVIKDAAGKYALANGAMIRRQTPDETLAAAAKRLKAVQANYVSVHQIMTSTHHVEESESEFEEVNQVATRASQKGKDLRRGFEGVFPPARKKHQAEHPT